MSFQKVKSLIQIVTAIQKSPDFFAGILVGLLFAIYLLSTDVIYDNFQSAYGNTKVTGLGRVCKNYPKTLAFTTVANRRERVGTFFVARIDYCNLERFLVSGNFFDSEYSGKDKCEG